MVLNQNVHADVPSRPPPLYPPIQYLPQRQYFLQFWGPFQESVCVNNRFPFSGKVVTPHTALSLPFSLKGIPKAQLSADTDS